jgi:CBS domain-containing protein
VTTARDIMSSRQHCASSTDSIVDAARAMRDLAVGALPVSGVDDRLAGMITDRDIVVKCVAVGGDPSLTSVGSVAAGDPVTIGADETVEETLWTMIDHGVHRLPVLDHGRLVGVVDRAAVARALPDATIVRLATAVSTASLDLGDDA